MKSTVLILIVVISILMAQLVAAQPNPPMTRIEFRIISPEIPADSFAAKPKIYYIAGKTYSRAEEQPDPSEHVHELIVCAEPDIWMINLFSHTAQHIVDPGPSFIVHHKIFEQDSPKEFSSLEFGMEVDYFRSHHAAVLKARALDGQRCEVSEFKYQNCRAVLFIRQDTRKPFHLDVFKDGKALFSIRYVSFKTNLAFDPALFKPPTGLTITEAKVNNTK